MEIGIAIVIATSIFLILLPKRIFRGKNLFKRLIINHTAMHTLNHLENQSFKKLLSMARKVSPLVSFNLLPSNNEKIKINLLLSGIDKSISTEDIIALKKFSSLVCLGFFMLLFVIDPSTSMFLVVGVVAVIGYYIPDNMLYGRAKKRQWNIQKELPATLTTLAIITDAGLNLFQAMERLSQENSNELSKELKLTVDDIKIGMSQKEAFERFAQRCSIEEVHYFISAVLQGLQKGSSGLTQIIRQQAEESWDKRKKKAKELAGRASIKLFLPLLLMVFPAFMIFLMGPMIFSLSAFFK